MASFLSGSVSWNQPFVIVTRSRGKPLPSTIDQTSCSVASLIPVDSRAPLSCAGDMSLVDLPCIQWAVESPSSLVICGMPWNESKPKIGQRAGSPPLRTKVRAQKPSEPPRQVPHSTNAPSTPLAMISRATLSRLQTRAREMRVHAHGAEVAQNRLARRVDAADLEVAARLPHALVAAVRLDEHLSLREGLEQAARELLGLADDRHVAVRAEDRQRLPEVRSPGYPIASLFFRPRSVISILFLPSLATPGRR
jgi:hypothetical protein